MDPEHRRVESSCGGPPGAAEPVGHSQRCRPNELDVNSTEPVKKA